MIALRNSTDLRLRVTLSCEWPVAATCKHAINKQAMVSLIIRKIFLYSEIRSKACWFEILFIDTIEGFENLPKLGASYFNSRISPGNPRQWFRKCYLMTA